MQTITLRSYVGKDGILKLQVPTGLSNVDLEILLVLQPVAKKVDTATVEETDAYGWPIGFFEETSGCLADDPISIDYEGDFEVRDELI